MRRLVPFVLLLTCAAATAQTYRWVDKDGKVHYTDTPPAPAAAAKVEEKRFQSSVLPGADKQPYETRRAAATFPVALYVTADCGEPCQSGRELLRRRNVPFAEKTVASKADEDALKKIAGGSNSVPTLTVGDRVQKGYAENLWNGLLDDAGYPPARAAGNAAAPVNRP